MDVGGFVFVDIDMVLCGCGVMGDGYYDVLV
jgi:hypothetical protein